MFKENYITKVLSGVLITLGIVTTIYVGLHTPDRAGTTFFFLLPLTFTICLVLFRKIIPYHRNGFGLKVLYAVIVVRYIIIPFLTCYVGTFSGAIYSKKGYEYGIFMQVVELLVTCIVIYYCFPKIYLRCFKKYESSIFKQYYDDISIGGVFVMLFSLFIISRRGIGNMLASMRFFVLTEGLEKEAMYGYDIWMAHTLLAFLVIISVASFQKREQRKKSIFNIIIPLIFVFLSCTMSFGDNRMTIVYYVISGLAVLLTAFPNRKTLIFGTIVPTFIIVIVSFTMIKQFGYDVSAGGDTGLEGDDLLSVMSAYVCTTQNIAKSYDMYVRNGDFVSIGSIFTDIVDGVTLLQLPFLQQIKNVFISAPSTIRLASTGTEVVPMAGQTLFWGGYGLGWMIDIIMYIIIIRLLIISDCYSKNEKRIGNTYLLTWVSVTFAMVMTYNFSIIWSSLNYTPFFVLCALYINRILRIKRKRIIV